MLDAAAGFERLLAFVAVANANIPSRTIAERGRKLLCEMRRVDDDIAHADRRELFQMMLDQHLAADAQQRLRRHVAQRAHAFAAAGGEDHRGADHAAVASSRGEVMSRSPSARSSKSASAAVSG